MTGPDSPKPNPVNEWLGLMSGAVEEVRTAARLASRARWCGCRWSRCRLRWNCASACGMSTTGFVGRWARRAPGPPAAADAELADVRAAARARSRPPRSRTLPRRTAQPSRPLRRQAPQPSGRPPRHPRPQARLPPAPGSPAAGGLRHHDGRLPARPAAHARPAHPHSAPRLGEQARRTRRHPEHARPPHQQTLGRGNRKPLSSPVRAGAGHDVSRAPGVIPGKSATGADGRPRHRLVGGPVGPGLGGGTGHRTGPPAGHGNRIPDAARPGRRGVAAGHLLPGALRRARPAAGRRCAGDRCGPGRSSTWRAAPSPSPPTTCAPSGSGNCCCGWSG